MDVWPPALGDAARADEIHLRIGQFAVGRSPCVLKTTLGSCVGVALLWPARGVFGLAHCLLPYEPVASGAAGARYVDQAVASLLRALQAAPADHRRLHAHLAGGATMGRGQAAGQAPLVGRQNADAAIAVLKAHRITVRSSDLGGECARAMRLDCSDGSVSVRRVPPVAAG